MMYAIEMLNIRKEFPGIVANDDITLQIKKNEIHALLGENGAGKSTLMSVLFGLYQPEKGEIKLSGNTVKISNPRAASQLGIGMVHQHFKLVDNFTVTENVILGIEDPFLDIKKASKKIAALSKQYGLDIDPDAQVSDITVGMQQRVEILKMLYRNADILIFDEPTAVLTPQEIEALMKIIQRLKDEGKTILIITHKLREIKAIAHRCTIIRLGKYVSTVNVSDVSERELAELMVGHAIQFDLEKKEQSLGEVVLDVDNLVVKSKNNVDVVKNLSFTIRGGEILGIAGVDGNGQEELIEAITGLISSHGVVRLNGEDINHKTIRYRTEKGIAHIPADRQKHGLVLDFHVYENAALQEYFKEKLANGIFISTEKQIAYANQILENFDVRSGKGAYSITRGLSGGNQQKLIIGRELIRHEKLVIAVQPTRGLDVGAIETIHKKILDARDAGAAVLLVSFELDEIMNLSDRIAVMYEGTIIDTLDVADATIAKLGLLMAGVKNTEEEK